MKRSTPWVVASLLLLLIPAGQSRAADGSKSAFQFRLGWFFPSADSGFWQDTEATFTLDSSDFNDGILGFTFVNSFSNHVEVGFNIDFYDTTVLSAERDFVDPTGLPILHDTRLQLIPITVDLRVLPGGRYRIRGPQGRRVRKPAFSLGGGLGATYWKYEEVGDFVALDPNQMPFIVFDRSVDDGFAFEVHALAGLELPLSRSWGLLFEGRYSWVDDDLGGRFAGLGTIDLGGASVYIGGAIHF